MIECDELRCECDVQTETFGINRNQNHSPQHAQQSLIRRRVHTTPTAIFAFHDSQEVSTTDNYNKQVIYDCTEV